MSEPTLSAEALYQQRQNDIVSLAKKVLILGAAHTLFRAPAFVEEAGTFRRAIIALSEVERLQAVIERHRLVPCDVCKSFKADAGDCPYCTIRELSADLASREVTIEELRLEVEEIKKLSATHVLDPDAGPGPNRRPSISGGHWVPRTQGAHPFSPFRRIDHNARIAAVMLRDRSQSNGRREANAKHTLALYEQGVQMESDSGLTLFAWDEIASLEFDFNTFHLPTSKTGKVHKLKTWPGPFEQLALGRKVHEVRKNDRDFSVGDTLDLEEFNPRTQIYTGNALAAEVSYITLGGSFGVPSDLCVMSLANVRWLRRATGGEIG